MQHTALLVALQHWPCMAHGHQAARIPQCAGCRCHLVLLVRLVLLQTQSVALVVLIEPSAPSVVQRGCYDAAGEDASPEPVRAVSTSPVARSPEDKPAAVEDAMATGTQPSQEEAWAPAAKGAKRRKSTAAAAASPAKARPAAAAAENQGLGGSQLDPSAAEAPGRLPVRRSR